MRSEAFSVRSERKRSTSSTVTRWMMGTFGPTRPVFSRVNWNSTFESACQARPASFASPIARIASTRSCRLSISEVMQKL